MNESAKIHKEGNLSELQQKDKLLNSLESKVRTWVDLNIPCKLSKYLNIDPYNIFHYYLAGRSSIIETERNNN